VEVATDKSLGDQVDAYIPMLHRAEARIDGLVELIGDLLTLSRSEQVRDLAGAELLAVEPAILAGMEIQKERLAAREIVAKVSIESDLPRVLISADDLDMIVGNLIGNAVKYNRDGGTVAVQAGRDGEWVRIDVKDTGIGIATEHLADVFSEFFREKRAETRDLEGNGLGLAITKRLVERAGGRLELASAEGKGSTFSVFLTA
jgi:signal transduction histidine kinase